MKNIIFTMIAAVMAALYWFVESIIHKHVFKELPFELIPSDINELQMRVVIVTTFLCFGLYVDKKRKVLRAKEEEERRIFRVTVHSAQLIIDKLLRNVRTGLNEIYKTKMLDAKTTQFLRESMIEAEKLEAKLVSITEINEETIKKVVEEDLNGEQ
ncbi:MAG: hypothetical protein HN764_03725 [Gammaproteobacteria bacterium]|jgi:hypothetical protein|nr:hypothetical protein [Gammaproteobacteria bacterium]